MIDRDRHPIEDSGHRRRCRESLDADGALVLDGFFTAEAVARVVADSASRQDEAFYADSTHNVYLTAPDPDLAHGHPFNRQVASSKGLLADDQVPADSPLRTVYDDPAFRDFLCAVLGIDAIHPYADDLSSINVHFAPAGRELGWHFDNSSFAVTMLLQAPEGGGRFEYVPAARQLETGDMGYEVVDAVLDGAHPVKTLEFEPGSLVLFRGRDALHRVTPTEGSVTRLLVVFAFNDQPGVGLSDSALRTFYGRTD
ncbi:MAG: 2OG-Fe(II) oxygenase [Actinomycetota bacterium]|nr:2OG-Fe(II) oxygenase [Actinomycetota bacterium]MEC9394405.1 2OG-Fe(II) oxygenase [Actinomycetota bacterium]MED6328055.1 2OG-Fe(II) oxygenase [Actinomycetota bacterium]MEE2957894.1 2OG-Fe(II) oxygenase [Actinomycetota bacterium]